jgi:hypothetical protein|tara:strand:- start:1208 stop:1426 length:219 start_codon:yes stop_codon:yes gene_type:complete
MNSEKKELLKELGEKMQRYHYETLKAILSSNDEKLGQLSGRPHLRERDNHPTEQLEDSSLRGDLRNQQNNKQ